MSKKPKKKQLCEYRVYVIRQVMICDDFEASSPREAALEALERTESYGERGFEPEVEPSVTVFKRERSEDGTIDDGVDYDVRGGELKLRHWNRELLSEIIQG